MSEVYILKINRIVLCIPLYTLQIVVVTLSVIKQHSTTRCKDLTSDCVRIKTTFPDTQLSALITDPSLLKLTLSILDAMVNLHLLAISRSAYCS